MRYDVTTLTILPGSQGRAVAACHAWCTAAGSRGKLLGMFLSENGDHLEITVFRTFEDDAALVAERWRSFDTTDPFGCGEVLVSFRAESFAPFPWMPAVQPGRYGELYEFRTYWVKHGGIPATMAAWAAAYAERVRFSPLIMAMYALEGEPRFTHIWPYRSLDARTKIRADTVAQGVWPPKGAPEWLTGRIQKLILLPTPGSPLR